MPSGVDPISIQKNKNGTSARFQRRCAVFQCDRNVMRRQNGDILRTDVILLILTQYTH